jgi:two-component system, NarL family, response regulator NreC
MPKPKTKTEEPVGDGQETITIVLADDHAVVREALRSLLEGQEDMEVVAEAGDVESSVRYVRGHKPTVLVLDLNMPGGPSIDAVPDILEASTGTGIVVLTMQDDPVFARDAMQKGVLGYILKHAAGSELVHAVRAAAAGETYLQPQLGAKLASLPEGPPDGLSERQLEVLRMIALGHTNTQIAEELFLSVRTVETHRAHIQQKLGLSQRSELVRYALDNKLLEDR